VKRREFLKLGLLGGSAAVYSGCSNADIARGIQIASYAAPAVQSQFMDESDEIRLGLAYYKKNVQKQGGLYQDKELQRAVREFSKPLFEQARRKNLPWEIVVVNDKNINAWALPGGKMAVNIGLLKVVKNQEELASVISHEIGHADLGHAMQSIKKMSYYKAIASVAEASLASYGGSAGAMSAKIIKAIEGPVLAMVNSGYSREHEFEADANIIYIFKKLRMDNTKAEDFFRTLDKIYPSKPGHTTSLFASHPATKERIARLMELERKNRYKPANIKLPGWDYIARYTAQKQKRDYIS
jgi:predicted Zn-dependent protease